MRARIGVTFSLLLMALALAGCQKPQRDDPIVAQDNAGFDRWIADHQALFTATELRELNEARQQFRFRVMQARPGLPASEASTALYADINGKTARELLLTSYALQIERFTTELANFEPQLKRFEIHDANRHLTEDERANVTANLETIRRKMKEKEDELNRLKSRMDEIKRLPAPAGKS